MTKRRQHGGAPAPNEPTRAENVNTFDAILKWLREHVGYVATDPSINPGTLARLTYELQVFQDKAFGKVQGSPYTKIPAKVFADRRPGGSLCRVLQTCYQHKVEKDWRRFTWNTPAKNDDNNELFTRIVTDLTTKGFLQFPVCYFTPSIPEDIKSKMRTIVEEHYGRVVDTPQAATHIILPEPEGYDDVEQADPALEYLRAIETGEKTSYVHWWYYPDSYNEWLPNSEVVGEAEIPEAPQGAYRVTAKFVLHTHKFNEWMNEIDYEPEDEDDENDAGSNAGGASANAATTGNHTSAVPSPRKRGRPRKDRHVENVDPSPVAKRPRTDNHPLGAAPHVLGPMGHQAPASQSQVSVTVPTPLQQVSKQFIEADATSAALNTAKNPITASNVTAAFRNPGQDIDPYKQALQQHAEQRQAEEMERSKGEKKESKSFDAEEVVVPSYAMWFTWGQIHELERKALPEFFDNSHPSKNEQTYVEYRDFMINTYRLDPQSYVTLTAVRRHLAGDICSLLRIHSFLEYWGLINYRVEPDTVPVRIAPPSTRQAPIMAALPKDQGTDPQVSMARVINMDMLESSGPVMRPALHLHPNKYGDLPPDQQLTEQKRTTCVTCNVAINPPSLYYYCPSRASYLCPSCFGLAQYPSELSSNDFYKIEADVINGEKQTQAQWTEQETLLLLEGIEAHPNHWDLIAQNVRTKTPQECVLQFLRLPIEDPYLTDQVEKLPEPVDPVAAVNMGQPLPFEGAANPLLSQIAFLSSVVNPVVAAAAAKAALKAVYDAKEEGAASGKGNAMDIDSNGVAADHKEGKKSSVDPLDREFTAEELKHASTTALAAAAVKASALAGEEEREIKRLVSVLIETQLQKIDLKMKRFSEIEKIFETERHALERAKNTLWKERMAFQEEKIAMERAQHKARAQQHKYREQIESSSPKKDTAGGNNASAAAPGDNVAGDNVAARSGSTSFVRPKLPELPTALSFTRQLEELARQQKEKQAAVLTPTVQNLDQKPKPKAAPVAPSPAPASGPTGNGPSSGPRGASPLPTGAMTIPSALHDPQRLLHDQRMQHAMQQQQQQQQLYYIQQQQQQQQQQQLMQQQQQQQRLVGPGEKQRKFIQVQPNVPKPTAPKPAATTAPAPAATAPAPATTTAATPATTTAATTPAAATPAATPAVTPAAATPAVTTAAATPAATTPAATPATAAPVAAALPSLSAAPTQPTQAAAPAPAVANPAAATAATTAPVPIPVPPLPTPKATTSAPGDTATALAPASGNQPSTGATQ